MLTKLLSRSVSNPRVGLRDVDDEFLTALGGARTSSGERVTRRTTLTLAAFYRGVSLISNKVAKLPFHVYEREALGGWSRADAHAAYQLVRYRSSAADTDFEERTTLTVRKTVTAHALLQGNGFCYVFRTESARPLEIVPLLPHETFAVRENGRLLYITYVAGQPRKLSPADVIHIRGVGYDGLEGYAVLQYGRESIGGQLGTHKFANVYYKNSARPSAVIEVPNRLGDRAFKNLQASWRSMYSGLDNAHRVAILEQGATLNPFAVNARDAQALETRKFTLTEAANWLGLPVHKLGGEGVRSYNSLTEENQSLLDDTLDDWLVEWETEYRRTLLTEAEKESDSHKIEAKREALARANLAQRAAYYRTALGGRPWMQQNEVRSAENLNPVPGGDVILDPLNMRPGGSPGGDAGSGDAAGDSADDAGSGDAAGRDAGSGDAGGRQLAARRRLLVETFGRALKRVAVQAVKASRNSAGFPDFLESFAADLAVSLETICGAALAVVVDDGDALAAAAAAELCGDVRDALQAVYDTATRAEFVAAVESALDGLARTLPDALAEGVLDVKE